MGPEFVTSCPTCGVCPTYFFFVKKLIFFSFFFIFISFFIFFFSYQQKTQHEVLLIFFVFEHKHTKLLGKKKRMAWESSYCFSKIHNRWFSIIHTDYKNTDINKNNTLSFTCKKLNKKQCDEVTPHVIKGNNIKNLVINVQNTEIEDYKNNDRVWSEVSDKHLTFDNVVLVLDDTQDDSPSLLSEHVSCDLFYFLANFNIKQFILNIKSSNNRGLEQLLARINEFVNHRQLDPRTSPSLGCLRFFVFDTQKLFEKNSKYPNTSDNILIQIDKTSITRRKPISFTFNKKKNTLWSHYSKKITGSSSSSSVTKLVIYIKSSTTPSESPY